MVMAFMTARRERLARDVLHEWTGALADERDRHCKWRRGIARRQPCRPQL